VRVALLVEGQPGDAALRPGPDVLTGAVPGEVYDGQLAVVPDRDAWEPDLHRGKVLVCGPQQRCSSVDDLGELLRVGETVPEVGQQSQSSAGERPVVGKETVPVERVRVGKEQVTDEQAVSEEVRKEQVEVEGDVDHR
jgi:hypothetical protein